MRLASSKSSKFVKDLSDTQDGLVLEYYFGSCGGHTMPASELARKIESIDEEDAMNAAILADIKTRLFVMPSNAMVVF